MSPSIACPSTRESVHLPLAEPPNPSVFPSQFHVKLAAWSLPSATDDLRRLGLEPQIRKNVMWIQDFLGGWGVWKRGGTWWHPVWIQIRPENGPGVHHQHLLRLGQGDESANVQGRSQSVHGINDPRPWSMGNHGSKHWSEGKSMGFPVIIAVEYGLMFSSPTLRFGSQNSLAMGIYGHLGSWKAVNETGVDETGVINYMHVSSG